MYLLIVRTGIKWIEEDITIFQEELQKQLPQFVVIVLQGENENIETSFETVTLY